MENMELFPNPAPDFTDPLGLLRACHQRVIQHCDLLEKLAAELNGPGPGSDCEKAADKVRHYFNTAARHHHEDEEQQIFPVLTRQSLKLADLVRHLSQQHQKQDELWERLEPRLHNLAAIDDPAAFSETAKAFAESQREHVQIENDELLEMARHIFSRAELKDIGRAMAERRGVQLPADF